MSYQHIRPFRREDASASATASSPFAPRPFAVREPVRRSVPAQLAPPAPPLPPVPPAPIQVSAAPPAGASQGLLVQAKWMPLMEPDPDWVYFDWLGYYSNIEMGLRYFPATSEMEDLNTGEKRFLGEDEEADLKEAIEESDHAERWSGKFVNSDNDMLYDLEERNYSFMDQPGIRVPASGTREHYFTLLEIAKDGGDVDAELRDALDELAESDEEDGEVPARQLTRGATIGFEFQELGSKVEVIEKPEEEEDESEEDAAFVFSDEGEAGKKYQAALDAQPTEVETELFGRDRSWYVVADGDNLEFVTLPFRTLAELRKTMAEVQAVAQLLAEADPGASYLLGDTVVQVLKPEGRAQPQANADIPLDTLGAFIADVNADAELRQEFFGVAGGFWQPQKTEEELAAFGEAATAVDGIPGAHLTAVFKGRNDAASLRSLRGMLHLMAQAIVHASDFPTALPKDQPLLLKTHMGKTWKSLVEDGIIGKRVKRIDVTGLLTATLQALELENGQQVDTVVRAVMSGTDPVWASDKEPGDLEEPGRKEIVVELRRVPILPIDEWGAFAEQAYHYFVTDAADRFS